MDFHTLPRRDLQALCKRNGIRANMTNAAMADALQALHSVTGIEEFLAPLDGLPTPASKAAVEAVAEEQREQQGSPLPRSRRVTVKSPEPIGLEGDKGEEEAGLNRDMDKEIVRTPGVALRSASRFALAAPVTAPTTRRRAAASKTEEGEASVEAVPTPATRRRSQRTAAAEEKEVVPRRTTRRAAARVTSLEQEEAKEPKDVASDMETVSAPVSCQRCENDTKKEKSKEPTKDEQSRGKLEEKPEQQQQKEGVVICTTLEEQPVTEECTSETVVQEQLRDIEQSAVPLPSQEHSPILGLVESTVAAPATEEEGGVSVQDVKGASESSLCKEMADEIHHIGEVENDVMPIDEVPQARVTAIKAIEEVDFTCNIDHTGEEENEVVAVEGMLHAAVTSNEAIELLFTSEVNQVVEEEKRAVATDVLSQATVIISEDSEKDNFTSKINHLDEDKEVLADDKEANFTDHITSLVMQGAHVNVASPAKTSPLIANMLDSVINSLSATIITEEPPVSGEEADVTIETQQDASLCIYKNGDKKKSIELEALREEKEVQEKKNKKPLDLQTASLRMLRAEYKKRLIAQKRAEARREALAELDENVLWS